MRIVNMRKTFAVILPNVLIISFEMESNQIAKQEKQKYLRDHIEADLYQDFAQFCLSYAGSLDIDGWGLNYIKQLVQKFYEDLNSQPKNQERSFAIYQSSTGDAVAHVMDKILQSQSSPIQEDNKDKENSGQNELNVQVKPEENAFKKKPKDQPPKSPQKDKEVKSSAMDLLDEVFQQFGHEQKSKLDEKAQKMNKSFFDSVNFWEVPKVQQKQKKPQKKEPQVQPYKNDHSTSFDHYFNTGVPHQRNQVSQKQFTTFSHLTRAEQTKSKLEENKSKISEQKKDKKSTIKLKQVKNLEPVQQEKKKLKKYGPKIPYDGANIIKEKFIDQVSCAKSAVRAALNNPQFQISICNFEIIHRNFFVSDYIMYHIKVQPAGYICKRNYQDFSKLKASLNKMYPGIQLPYLEKDSWLSDTSSQFANKQAQILQFFLRDILANRQLKNSRIVEDFLTFPDHKKIKRKFEEYDKMEKLKSIEDLCLLSGEVSIKFTEDQRIYCEKAHRFVQKMEHNYDKYRKNSETLSHQFNNIMNTLSSLNDLMKEMQDDIIDFNKRVRVNEINDLDDSFRVLGNSYQEQYMRFKFQKKILDEQILPFIRYQKQNIHVSKQIIDQCSYMTNRFLKRQDNEGKVKKSSSYLSNANREFKNGVLQESKNLLVYQYQVGYMNNQMSNECERIFEELSNKINKNLRGIGKMYLNEFSKSVNFWSSVI